MIFFQEVIWKVRIQMLFHPTNHPLLLQRIPLLELFFSFSILFSLVYFSFCYWKSFSPRMVLVGMPSSFFSSVLPLLRSRSLLLLMLRTRLVEDSSYHPRNSLPNSNRNP